MGIDQELNRLGLRLPDPPPALANYRSWGQSGNLLFMSGCGPFADGDFQHRGRCGAELTLEDGIRAAEMAALSLLATLKGGGVDLDRVSILKMQAFISSGPDFVDQHRVADGASNMLTELLGSERGAHARSAVGVPRLPTDISVEIDTTVSVE